MGLSLILYLQRFLYWTSAIPYRVLTISQVTSLQGRRVHLPVTYFLCHTTFHFALIIIIIIEIFKVA